MRQRALAQDKSCGPRSSGRLAKVMLEVVDRLVIEASRLKKSIEIKLDGRRASSLCGRWLGPDGFSPSLTAAALYCVARFKTSRTPVD